MARVFKVEELSKAVSLAASQLGYKQLKPEQDEVVKEFVCGKDVFVSLPTGSGKSLCYAVLPAVFDILHHFDSPTSMIIVVSPLIALMKDQVETFKKKGLKAAYICPSDSEAKLAAMAGDFQLMYVSPETLLTDLEWRDILQSPFFQHNLEGLVIDEAHCVKKWGETFRKEFSKIGEVRSIIPDHVNVMALTATATKATRKYVCQRLGMRTPLVISRSPNKSNIKFVVHMKEGSVAEIMAALADELIEKRTAMPRVIIFARTYDACGELYVYFKNRLGQGLTEPVAAPNDLARFRLVDMFTACTKKDVKDAILHGFCDPCGNLRIVVATIAFGLGLDCPNVRRVIHWGAPSDVEEYMQETGRAGRDGKSSVAILYYSNTDFAFVSNDSGIKTYCKNEEQCRRKLLLKDFDHEDEILPTGSCSCCDICASKCSCNKCKSKVQ